MTSDPMLPKTHYTIPVDSILLLGPTGVGKSPLGDVIAQHGLFGRLCHQFDFGSELRSAVSSMDRVGFAEQDVLVLNGIRAQRASESNFNHGAGFFAYCIAQPMMVCIAFGTVSEGKEQRRLLLIMLSQAEQFIGYVLLRT